MKKDEDLTNEDQKLNEKLGHIVDDFSVALSDIDKFEEQEK